MDSGKTLPGFHNLQNLKQRKSTSQLQLSKSSSSGAPTNYPIEDPSALLETSKGIFFLFQNLAVVKSNRSILLYTLKQLFCETE